VSSKRERYVTIEPPFNPQYLAEYLSRELRRVENAQALLTEREDIAIYDTTAVAGSSEVCVLDTSAQEVIINLPNVALAKGKHYLFKRTKAGTNKSIVRAPDGGIEGAYSATLSAQWQTLAIVSDGEQWLKK